jgi:diguanylate cyclase (GGDEF)-like protein
LKALFDLLLNYEPDFLLPGLYGCMMGWINLRSLHMKEINRSTPRSRFFIACIIASVLLVVPVGLGQIWLDDAARRSINDLSSPIVNLAATAALGWAAYKSMRISRRLGWAWGLLCTAQFCLLVGDMIWGAFELVLNISPFPSAADGAYILFYPFFLAGILLLPAYRLTTIDGLKRSLDIGIVFISALLAFWNFLIGPMITAGSGNDLLDQVLTLAYPAGDLVMMYALLSMLYHRSGNTSSGTIWLLEAGAAITIIADIIFSYQNLVGTFQSGTLLDSGWMVGYLLTGLAGVVQATSANPAASAKEKLNEQATGWLAYLPYGWLLAAYLLLVENHYAEEPANFLPIALGVAVIISLVIIRQIIAHEEIKKLLANLTHALDQVHRQTSELDAINRSLQQEISDRQRIQQQLSYDALHDTLTGLPNRALLIDRLDHAVEQSRRNSGHSFSVLFLDVDAFKVINDSLGHMTGDYLLVEIAKRLKKCLRSLDTVARFGGDEFVVLLENVAHENIAVQVADRIQKELTKVFVYKGQEVHLTGSIGILKTINDFASSEEILRNADIAMYWAKSSGKARYEIFTPDLQKAALKRMEIENELRSAINNNEFFFHYQPIFSLKTGAIIGFEALLRWQNPQRGVVMPSDFIQVAEETGLIIPIGKWGLLEACDQLKRWQDRSPALADLSVNVNISVKQLCQLDFVETVREAVKTSGINPSRLNLEITENVMVANQKLILAIFAELRKLGIKLQIDDFGTGYSSLSYLQYFPVDTLKVDRSFVQDMHANKKSHDLVHTIIQMAWGLGLETIAEGVETENQLEELKSLGCHYVQGFLLSRPLPREMAEARLDEQAAHKPGQTGSLKREDLKNHPLAGHA